jgi:MFS family permease
VAEEKRRSLRALDALNFCNAGIQTGLGPFIAIFYAPVRHWHPGQIGILLACQSFAGILIQPAVGHWMDESHKKRVSTAAAAVTVALAALGIALLPTFAWQVVMQLLIGLAITVFAASTSAFALGMVDQKDLPHRIARNETFTHTGNVVFAIAAGLLGTFVTLKGIFYAAAAFASGMAVSAIFIDGDHVDHEAARAGGDTRDGNGGERTGFRQLFRDKRILTFTASVVLFYFANAATLPLVAQILTKGQKGRGSAWQVAAAIVVAEAVMVLVAAYSGKFADRWGRKPVFLIGFGALALRNALTVVNHGRYYLISLQAFDGVAMAIYGVLLTLVTADLAKGTGRFNFLQGAVQSSMGLGGFLSNSLFGFVAKMMGFNVSFWGLAAVAVAGGTLYQMKMPETRPQEAPAEEHQPAT